ncbi:hypothetical protein ABZW02_25515 [Streptomyces sp. NPDC005180]|uniref:hypothetical protein n=1 Tax=Streptomyces sp. NPDC005180 TaxID=3156868 RepID=UPI0033B6EB29
MADGTDTYTPPPGRVACRDCLGLGVVPNFDVCIGPCCEDRLTVECFTCDGLGHV